MTLQEFNDMVSKGIVILDGATGSWLRNEGMPVGVCVENWILEHPEVILRLQRAYVEAGSDIIYAPTFSSNRIGLKMHGLEDRLKDINTGLVALSQQAADGRAWVAGDVTTTGRVLEPMGDMSYQELFDIYTEQISVIAEAGADLLVAETMLAIDETAVAVEAARSVCNLPMICTLTLESDGHVMFGGSAAEAVETLQAVGAAAVGLNCSVGPDQLESVVRSMQEVASVPIIAKPNAGMPTMDDRGYAHYDMSPERFAAAMKRLVGCGAGIVGGCCGTSPEYIRQLARAVKRQG